MKIANFEEFHTELVTTIIYIYGFINSTHVQITHRRSLGCFEAAKTASLAALIVAEGSVLDNRTSGSGRVLDTGLKYRLRAIRALTNASMMLR